MTKKLQISFLTLLGLITFSTIAMGQVNMNRWVEMSVAQGQLIQLKFASEAPNTSILIRSGTIDSTIIVGTGGTVYLSFMSYSPTMRVYGNLKEFYCAFNGLLVTSLDASHSLGLIYIFTNESNLSSINVNGLTNLKNLRCESNKLTDLNLSGLSALEGLYCSGNSLTNININGCNALKKIDCSFNNLTTLTLDKIYCALPTRSPVDNAKISPIFIPDNEENVMATNKSNAINKNWKVVYSYDNTEIPATTGTYVCTISTEDVNINNIEAKVYPNPVSNALNIDTQEKVEDIILYDVLGKEVLRTTKTNNIDVSNLNKGIYILKLITEKGIGEYKIVKD